MGCKIIFSPQAIADLEAAVRFIARENPDAAKRVGDSLIDRVAILENFPLIGPRYQKRRGVRFLVSRPYIIFYRPDEKENCIEILRYWHVARSKPEL
ncbi:MAG TPA: type II toxin-antitoxin system RelE/ParE family toxin [Verrucomicrobiae bacterium]|nr:type II toxin-antitoxin system RelE/ParE family toxin [Verrucomicrobiae bacterium]